MEYLMTYGWAILIVGVALGGLFSLGVFSSSTLAPRAQPGNCHVFRPGGSGSSSYANLEGVCSGELPEYVMRFTGSGSYVQVPDSSTLRVGDPYFTFSAWIDPLSLSSCGSESCIIFNKENSYEWALSSSGQLCWAIRSSSPGWNWECTQIYLSTGSFYDVALTYDGSNVIAYLNGQPVTTLHASGNVDNTGYQNALRIGARGAPGGAGSFFNGMIADVQIYNATLDANAISALYLEGIGGAPASPAYIEGWWPLNGNANDYSGNSNGGATTSVSYSSSYTSSYTVP